MIQVPKKRYETLIEVYAMSVADHASKQFEKYQTNKKSGIELNSEEQKSELKKEKYENIVKSGDLELGSMTVFFKRLAEKFGFQT